MREIMSLKQGNHFQLACQRTWKAKHPKTFAKIEDELNVIHPLEYFRFSRLYYEEEAKTEG